MRKIVPVVLLLATIFGGALQKRVCADEIACKCCKECLQAQKPKIDSGGKKDSSGGCQECCRRCGIEMAFGNLSGASR